MSFSQHKDKDGIIVTTSHPEASAL
jgi:hypothetical protein